MTAERPGGEWPTPRAELTASPANAETPAVNLCPGYYVNNMFKLLGESLADCDVCGVTGPAGSRCEQTVMI